MNVAIIKAISIMDIIKPARHIFDFIKKKFVEADRAATTISVTRQGTTKVASPTGAPI